MLNKRKIAAATAALATLAVAGAAFADSPLAQYSQVPGDTGSSLIYTNGVLSTPAAGYATQFSFQAPGLPGGNIDANLTFTATASGPAQQGGVIDSQPLDGSFKFVSTMPFTVGTENYASGTTLLAGTFTDSTLYGVDSGSTGSLADSRLAVTGGTVNFTSGVSQIMFGSGDEGLSIALNSVVPGFFISGANLGNFTATSTGSFAADVTIGGGAGGVPEVGTWALMILGCGIAGAQIRARRSALVKS